MKVISEKTNSRYEKKFLFPKYFQENGFLIIDSNIAGFNEIYKKRVINSIYFDTPDLIFAKQNINGDSERYKLRIRYYGQVNNFEKPHLELKARKGDISYKCIFNFDYHNSINIDFNKFNKIDLIPSKISNLLPFLTPVLMVNYERHYYLSKCGKYRLTYDLNIKYGSLNILEKNFIEKINFIESDLDIIELKYGTNRNLHPGFITKDFPFRYSRNSKYINGLYSIGRIE